MQRLLIPLLEDCAPAYDRVHLDLMLVLEVLRVESIIPSPYPGRGRPQEDRRSLFRAFVAKAVLNLVDTRDLIARLCTDESLARVVGYFHCGLVPSESTFSRAFAEFASNGYAEAVHGELLARHASSTFAVTVSRDSTAIEARQKPIVKPKKSRKKDKKRKPGPRTKDSSPPELTRLDRQLTQSWQEAVAELPTACDTGVKHNSKRRQQFWNGYKFHVDVAEDGLPLAAITTSASLQDSQVAIPLSKKSHERCFGCYKLMDSAYWVKSILAFEQSLGSVPIVPGKKTQAGDPVPLAPDRRARFKGRTVVERFNSQLKDNFGGRFVRVKGHSKVHLHLMMGLLACAAFTILRH